VTARVPAVVVLAQADSTMDVLHGLAQGGAPAGTAVVAEEQVNARGSRGQRWVSPPGGLWLSVLLRPDPAGLELMGLRAALAVVEALDGAGLDGAVRLKWPNDLMLEERKAGGILCEARWHGTDLAWVAVGLGLNVTNPPPAELEALATHLSRARPSLTAAELVSPVVEAIRAIAAAAGPLTEDERARYARRDWLRGRRLQAPLAGTADGLGEDGALLVRRADGATAAIRAGSIVLAASGSSADLSACS